MQNFFKEKGLVHQTTCPHTPEQNGVAERKNRYILEITRAFLIESKIPKSFWPEAIATSVYLINRLPTKILAFKIPLEILSTQISIPSSLTLEPKVFGCTAFVHIPKQERSKFSPCAVKCVFLGYGKNQKGYRCYDPKTRTLYTTMNCDFVEGEYFYSQSRSQGETQSDNTLSDSPDWLPTFTHNHRSNQGETNSDGEIFRVNSEESPQLNPGPVTDVGPTEVVSGTAEPLASSVQDEAPSATPKLSDPLSDPEVTILDCDSVPQDTTNVRQDEATHSSERGGVDGDTGQYELPPRSTRGIPPRRYSSDWKGQKTRYSVANIVQEQLTEMARAFETALYEEEEIPQSVQEAMRHKHWRAAMKKEMDALIKSQT